MQKTANALRMAMKDQKKVGVFERPLTGHEEILCRVIDAQLEALKTVIKREILHGDGE